MGKTKRGKQGRVIMAFIAMVNGHMQSYKIGDLIEIPEGMDWVKAGFVVVETGKKAK